MLPLYNQPLYSNLSKDEQQELKRLNNDQNVVILAADIGRVTTVVLVNDKQPYEELNATHPQLFNVNLTAKYLL